VGARYLGNDGTLKVPYAALGIMCIIVDIASIPQHAYLGIMLGGSSGLVFWPLLWSWNPPVLFIIGSLLGAACVTASFSSEIWALILSGVSSGFALTFLTTWGSWTSSQFSFGWPLPWAYQILTFGPPGEPLLFSIDFVGLTCDVAFWGAIVAVALVFLRHAPSRSQKGAN